MLCCVILKFVGKLSWLRTSIEKQDPIGWFCILVRAKFFPFLLRTLPSTETKNSCCLISNWGISFGNWRVVVRANEIVLDALRWILLILSEDSSKNNNFKSIFPLLIHGDFSTHGTMLQKLSNVKLRLNFVEIWSFYCLSDFTWNQILVHWNGQKMSFSAIL